MAVVDAQILDSEFDLHRPNHTSRRGVPSWLWMAMVVILACAATGVGVYCATGNCSGSDTDENGSTQQSDATNTPVTSPVPAPMEDLTVACSFLSIPDLAQCQATTVFTGTIVGSTIPTEIGWLTQLTSVNLQADRLNGAIPTEIGRLTKIAFLNLNVNLLTSTIPMALGNLSGLTSLFLSSNQLIGTIPPELGNMVKLKYMDLSINELTGTVPSILGNLTQLSTLRLYGNSQLGGFIPSSLCSISAVVIDCDDGSIECSCCTDAMSGVECAQ